MDQQSADKDEMVRMTTVILREEDGVRQVILKEDETARRYFDMAVGPLEFMALAKEQGKIRPPRPLTHDLYLALLEGLDIGFDHIEIHDRRGDTYIAAVVCTKAGRPERIDARPSDSVALALNRKLPIYVHRKLLKVEPSEEDAKLYKDLCKIVRFKPE
jgi:bifunctional DNase/RNase